MELGAFPAAGMRVVIAALFLLPILLVRGVGPPLRTHWKATFATGFVNSAIPFACFTFALLSISTGLTSILNATAPLFGAVVAWLWLKDRPNRSRTLGLLIGFLGGACWLGAGPVSSWMPPACPPVDPCWRVCWQPCATASPPAPANGI